MLNSQPFPKPVSKTPPLPIRPYAILPAPRSTLAHLAHLPVLYASRFTPARPQGGFPLPAVKAPGGLYAPRFTLHATHYTLHKTKPIPQTPKPPQALMIKRLTASLRTPPTPENKPNQTQSYAAMAPRGLHAAKAPGGLYATRYMQTDPNQPSADPNPTARRQGPKGASRRQGPRGAARCTLPARTKVASKFPDTDLYSDCFSHPQMLSFLDVPKSVCKEV